MLVKGTYFQNDTEKPLVYGDVEISNVKRQRLRGEELKEGILCEPVMVGFCGTDFELMHMGSEGRLSAKFPEGKNRLINGHGLGAFDYSLTGFQIRILSYHHNISRKSHNGKSLDNLTYDYNGRITGVIVNIF